MDIEFEWDDEKNATNIRKHGIDFGDAIDVFDGRPRTTIPSTFSDEERYITTAIVKNRFMTAIWTPRDNRIRLISARRSRGTEKRTYHEENGLPNS